MLNIEASTSEAGPFFRYVTVSPGAAVRIVLSQNYTDCQETDAALFATVLRNIARSYSNPASSGLPFKTLVVDHPAASIAVIHLGLFNDIFGESAELFDILKSPRCGLNLTFSALKLASASWFSAVLPGIFSAGFPLDNISHAHLGYLIPLDEENPRLLAETVGLLPALSFVKVSGLIGPCLVHVAGFSHTGEDVLTPFPSLESIHFRRVPFLPCDKKPKEILDLVDGELLQQFLMTRGATVRRLRLEGCLYLKKADVDKLCKVVGDVVCWDEEDSTRQK
ncbi:hypothetical protein HYPSUDRAFT_44276 [Hypholoma sublateritium FD-334 SS-4]|uniref:F-box domain-containing protein n=1 Tax=Hypholoma sublateritium (strain FD-334 SS-4) TaxID=945553 RepID=A0A0D2NKU9_HYPSF|nr:hypothetical protein HYPSUDRAFT_44276 [Hypholoma sublateritium FD-334 SS-4]